MDDFLEHMLSSTPWTEMGGMSNPIGNQGLSSQAQELHGNLKHAEIQANLQYSLDDQLIITSLPSPIASTPNDSSATGQPFQHTPDMVLSPMKKISEGMSNIALLVPQNDSMNTMVASVCATQLLAAAGGFPRGLTRSVSIGSSGTEGSAIQQVPPNSQSSPGAAPTWCQPYIGAGMHHPIMKRESFLQCEATSDDARMLVKRSRTDNEDGLFMSFGGTQTGQRQIARVAGQESNLSAGEGISVSPYGSHTGLAQPQNTSGIVPITAKPRVRARRGQATDPHSIAERLRRERIAARMKALQELVPNSNKTDKASMLDEIIEYVKFLQLQVKVLSMSRLGGSSGVAPLVADLPTEGVVGAGLGQNVGASVSSQDGMSVAERQVARLMEEDMGSAMQYLQSKGLCLMPISLATTISTTSARSQINNNSQGGIQGLGLSNECPRLDVATSTPATSSITSVASGAIISLTNNASDPVSNDSVAKGINGGFNMDIKRMPSTINP